MSLYMHTIDGQPAILGDHGYICFAGKTVTKLATSLEQIKREQRELIAKDAAAGVGPFKYGYVRITERAVMRVLADQGVL